MRAWPINCTRTRTYHLLGCQELWRFLRPRLRFIVELQREWGNIHQLYPTGSESLYEDIPLPPGDYPMRARHSQKCKENLSRAWLLCDGAGIRDPDSLASGLWDLMGLVLLLW